MLGEVAARSAMQQPAQRAGVDFTEAAARKLANDLRFVRVDRGNGVIEEQRGPYVEPVQLQVVCYRLWDRLPTTAQQITEADVVAVGNVDSALSDYYAERVARAAQAAGISRERVIRDWVEQQLITAQGIRNQILQGPYQGLDDSAVRLLLDDYLVRAEIRRGAVWLELAHDRLIAPVQANNAAWREANLSALQRQADLWEKQNRPDGALLRDRALSEAEAWAEAHSVEPTSLDQAYLAACRKARAAAQRERRNNRLIRGLAVAAYIGLILAGVAAVVAAQNAQRADAQSVIANQNATLAEQKRVEAEAAQKQADANAAEAKKQADIAAANEATAQQERDKAIAQQKIAEAQRLVAQAQITLKQGNAQQLAMLLALAAQENSPSPESENVLRSGLARLPIPICEQPDLKYVNAVAFAPDGNQFATADDNGLQVWDAKTGEVVRKPIEKAVVRSVVFSPDGAWLISGEEKQARIWDAAGKPVVTLQQPGWVVGLAMSPDGKWLAAGTDDGSVSVWQTDKLRAGDTTAAVTYQHDARVNQLAFSPDSKLLASASDDGTAWVWAVAANQEVGRVTHNGPVLSVAFSPDSQRLATGGGDSTARVWNLAGNAPAETQRLVHNDWVENVVFSPDGQTLATASDDGTARVWNTANGQELLRLPHKDAVRMIAFSPNGNWIATGSADHTARLWDAATGQEMSQMPQLDTLTALAYNPIGSRLVTADASGLAQLWDTTAIDQMEVARVQQKGWVRDIAFSADGSQVATASDDGFTAWLWNIAGKKPQVIREFQRDNQEFVRSVALSVDGRWLAAGGDDRTVWVWDLKDKQAAPRRLTHDGEINTVAFSPDSQLLASGGADSTVHLWDVTTGEERQKLKLDSPVTSVVFNSDGKQLAATDEDGYFKVWEVATGKEALTGPQSDYLLRDIAFSPDGHTLAITNDRYVTLWDAVNNIEIRKLIHDSEVRSVAFSPDGRLIASTSDDGTTRLWAAGSGAELARLFHMGNSLALAFDSKGDRLAIADGDVAHVLDVNQAPLVPTDQLAETVCARLTRNLTRDEWQVYFGDAAYRKLCPTLP